MGNLRISKKDNMKKILRSYQQDAFLYGIERNAIALYIRMRFGKSIVAIRICLHKSCEKILIVGPHSVSQGWEDEIKEETGKDLHYLTGTTKERQIKLSEFSSHKWFFFNKEGHRYLPEVKRYQWDTIILDERFITYPDSDVTKFYHSLPRYPNQTRFILTGTPAPESEMEYFSQLYFLDPEILGCANIWQFRRRYFQEVADRVYYLTRTGKKNLTQRLAEHCFFFTKEDAKKANLYFDPVMQTRVIQPDKKFQQIYEKLIKFFVLEDGEGNLLKMLKYNISQFLWARRLTGGYLEDDFVFDFKMKDLLHLLKTELKDEKVVIWADFTKEIKQITRTLNNNNITADCIYGAVNIWDRKLILEDFNTPTNQGGTQCNVIQPKCFQQGTDLSVSSTMIYYSLPVSSSVREQTMERIRNLQKKGNLLIIDLVLKNTIDESVQKSLKKKEKQSSLIMNIVRDMYKQINQDFE